MQPAMQQQRPLPLPQQPQQPMHPATQQQRPMQQPMQRQQQPQQPLKMAWPWPPAAQFHPETAPAGAPGAQPLLTPAPADQAPQPVHQVSERQLMAQAAATMLAALGVEVGDLPVTPAPPGALPPMPTNLSELVAGVESILAQCGGNTSSLLSSGTRVAVAGSVGSHQAEAAPAAEQPKGIVLRLLHLLNDLRARSGTAALQPAVPVPSMQQSVPEQRLVQRPTPTPSLMHVPEMMVPLQGIPLRRAPVAAATPAEAGAPAPPAAASDPVVAFQRSIAALESEGECCPFRCSGVWARGLCCTRQIESLSAFGTHSTNSLWTNLPPCSCTDPRPVAAAASRGGAQPCAAGTRDRPPLRLAQVGTLAAVAAEREQFGMFPTGFLNAKFPMGASLLLHPHSHAARQLCN